MSKKITASFIIEILGRPSEHVKSSLEEIEKKLKELDGVVIIESVVHEPKEMEIPKEVKKPEKGKELYTSFLDVEADFDNIEKLLTTCLTYMPSNVEISNPTEVGISNSQLSEIISGLMLRLHKYDEVTRKLLADRDIMINKIKELMDEKEGKEGKGKEKKSSK